MPAQVFPICIHIAAFRGGSAIYCTSHYTPLLLLILAAAALASLSATTAVAVVIITILNKL